jgi:pyruvate,water dikinase
MTASASPAELHFDPPGPGPWNLDPVHFPRPVTNYWVEMHPEPFARGFRELAAYYGLLFKGMEFQYVNGFAYSTMRPLDEQEIPGRIARTQEVVEGKLWRAPRAAGHRPGCPL